MLFRLEFILVDSETGEVLTHNTKKDITTDSVSTPSILHDWIDCYYRGLRSGRVLSMELYGDVVTRCPTQLDIF